MPQLGLDFRPMGLYGCPMTLSRREWSSQKLRPGTSSHKLALLLEARDMGARSLAKLIAPHGVDDMRKNVRRWLTGTTPNRASRDAITDALGVQRGAIEPDPEEESLNAALFREIRAQREQLDRFESLLSGDGVAA